MCVPSDPIVDSSQALWSVDPSLPLADVHTLEYFYKKSMARTSFTLVMLALAGSMALLLGIVASTASSPIPCHSGRWRSAFVWRLERGSRNSQESSFVTD